MSHFARLGNDLFTGKRSVNVVGRRNTWYVVAAVLLVVSAIGIFGRGLNFGIEFTGGTEVRATQIADMSDYESRAQDAVTATVSNAGEVSVTQIGDDTVRIQMGEMPSEQANQVAAAVGEEFGVSGEDLNSSVVGPSWGSTVTTKAVQALVVFMLLVALVLAVYFRTWKMAASALIALIHDVVFTVGVYALLGVEISPASVIGFLTILGYSIYDTIVVFDKVKENTEYAMSSHQQTFAEAANLAVNQTIVRSINTSVVALLPVGAILVMGITMIGPGTLLDLSAALFVGIAVGTYSSIFLATPILVHLRQGEAEIQDLDKKVAKRKARAAKAEEAAAQPQATDDATTAAAGSSPEASATESEGGTGSAVTSGRASTAGRQIHPMAQRGPRNQPRRAPRSRR